MVCYFTPLQTGAYRLYSTRDSSFWCCVGSGFESHVKYASSIYFHSNKDLYVNLFIPSQVDWEGTKLVQQTNFPLPSTTTITVEGKSKAFSLRPLSLLGNQDGYQGEWQEGEGNQGH